VRPAVFLDRDGVINANRVDHVKSWNELRFMDCAFPALRRLAQSRIPVVVVTNQSAVGRGLMSLETATMINRRLTEEVEAAGGRITATYLCPHHPDARCACRKPAPGMLLQAAREWDLDLSQSYLVGDAVSDMSAARAANARGILVMTGRGTEQSMLLNPEWGCTVVQDLGAAVETILSASSRRV